MVIALLVLKRLEYFFCKSLTALTAFCPYLGKCKLTATTLAECADKLILCLGVGDK